MAIDELSEELVREFAQLRDCSPQEYHCQAQRLLGRIIAARDVASDDRLALLDVAEAAARGAARLQWGRSELALRAFAAAIPDEAARLLELLLEGPVARPYFSKLAEGAPSETESLFRMGAVIPEGDSEVRLASRLRPAARDLLRPPVLRMWAAVEGIRDEASDSAKPASVLASRLGIETAQAEDFLREFPLDTRPVRAESTAADDEPLARSVTPVRVLYSRVGRRAASPVSTPTPLVELLERIGLRNPIPISVADKSPRQGDTTEVAGSESSWVA